MYTGGLLPATFLNHPFFCPPLLALGCSVQTTLLIHWLLATHPQSIANLIPSTLDSVLAHLLEKPHKLWEQQPDTYCPQSQLEAGYPVSIPAKLGDPVSKILLALSLEEAGCGQSRDPCKAGKASSQRLNWDSLAIYQSVPDRTRHQNSHSPFL